MSEGLSENNKGRLILDEAHDGDFNMAADFYLTQTSKMNDEPILRFYRWENPTLSIGYHQKLSAELLLKCHKLGVPVVRRPTGGRAVLHDNELTYCLALPLDHSIYRERKREIYQSIGSIFVQAAKDIGLDANLVRAGSKDKSNSILKGSPLCFDAIARWEVQLSGAKWIGSAQRIFPEVLLQHGSILLGESRVDINSLFGLNQKKYSTQAINNITFDSYLLRESIAATFSRSWNVEWYLNPMQADEIDTAALNSPRYRVSERSITKISQESIIHKM